MLQILRKKAQSPLIQIIVVIIALVFIFWGVGSNLGDSRQAALVVNGEEITFQQYQQAYDSAYQRLSDQFGGNVPKGLAETFGIKQQVINQLIQTTLLRQGAAEMGILVSGDEIRDFIQKMVQFQEDGKFSMERYKTLLAANRMAPTKFEQSMRFDRLSEVAAREIGRFSAAVTDFEIQDTYSRLNEKIAVKYVRLSPSDFTEKVVVDDTALSAWFEAAKDRYKTEPLMKFKYLLFTYDEIGGKVVIDKDKIAEYYQNNLETFKVAEQRHARHILFKAEEGDSADIHEEKARKAAEVLQLIRDGGDFISLAREYSEGPSKNSDGDLGFFARGRMIPEFEDAVFAMQPGAVSEVVKTNFGYHIIRLEEIKPAATRTLEAATAEITRTLQQKEAESLAFQVANDAYEGIIGAGSLGKYAETNKDITILETDFFGKSDAPAGLKNDQQFLDKAFELNKGELSSLIKGSSGYAILFAEDMKEPEVPQLTAIKEKVEADYRKEKSQGLAETAAKDLLGNVRGGKSLDEAAAETGLTVKESGLFGQNDAAGKNPFPSSLTQDAFLLSASSPLPENPGQADDDYYVYTFLDRKIPTMPETADEIKKYRENLERFKQQQLISAWLRHLEIDSKITQHENL
jgi:peptidyl-prolyl cis-trans isomerase D